MCIVSYVYFLLFNSRRCIKDLWFTSSAISLITIAGFKIMWVLCWEFRHGLPSWVPTVHIRVAYHCDIHPTIVTGQVRPKPKVYGNLSSFINSYIEKALKTWFYRIFIFWKNTHFASCVNSFLVGVPSCFVLYSINSIWHQITKYLICRSKHRLGNMIEPRVKNVPYTDSWKWKFL